MSPGHLDAPVVRRHLLALDQTLRQLARHAGRPLSALTDDPDEAWAVEHGLQLCAQNALDVATHLAATSGRDAADYTGVDFAVVHRMLNGGLAEFAEFARHVEAHLAAQSS